MAGPCRSLLSLDEAAWPSQRWTDVPGSADETTTIRRPHCGTTRSISPKNHLRKSSLNGRRPSFRRRWRHLTLNLCCQLRWGIRSLTAARFFHCCLPSVSFCWPQAGGCTDGEQSMQTAIRQPIRMPRALVRNGWRLSDRPLLWWQRCRLSSWARHRGRLSRPA